MKKLLIAFIIIAMSIILTACVVSEEYINSETEVENNTELPVPATPGNYNETYDVIRPNVLGFDIVNDFLLVPGSNSLYAYDPEKDESVIMCPDPTCDHRECFFGYKSIIVTKIVQCNDRLYTIRTVPLSSTITFDNGMESADKYQIISADLNGNNIVLHYEYYDYVDSLCVTDDNIYFIQRNINEGVYELCKLTIKNNKVELLKSSAQPEPICENNGYLYYNDKLLDVLGRIELKTGKDEIILDRDDGNYYQYNDNYMWFVMAPEIAGEPQTVCRYDFHTGEIVEIMSGSFSRFIVTDNHIFFTKNENNLFEFYDGKLKDFLNGRIYMCDIDGNNIVMIRNDYKKIYYRIFIPYHDKLFVKYKVYDEKSEESKEDFFNGLTYGYVNIGDVESDYTTFTFK